MSKLIDMDRKGNLVRFYFGKDNCHNYHGDDWDDIPYEYNAGIVYDEFITCYMDVVFPFDVEIKEPSDLYCNSPFCREDFKDGWGPDLCCLYNKVVLATFHMEEKFCYVRKKCRKYGIVLSIEKVR